MTVTFQRAVIIRPIFHRQVVIDLAEVRGLLHAMDGTV